MYKKISRRTAPSGTLVSGAISSQTAHLGAPSSRLLQPLSVPQTPSSSSQVSFSAQAPLIMVIDDSDTVRKILQACLGREGFLVVVFPDGIAAMKWLTQPDSRIPHVIILDIGLPRMDGYEVAKRFKARPQFNDTVIIMLSRRNGVIDRLKGKLVGAREYLTKPLQTQEITAVVKSYMGSPMPQ